MEDIHNQQRELLKQALEAFQKTTSLAVVTTYSDYQNENIIAITNKAITYHFNANITLNLTKAALSLMALDAKKTPSADIPKDILVTRYVTPQMSKQMIDLNMPFIDAAGNAYLNEEQLFIYATGSKLKQSISQVRLKRLFTAAELRVIFVLLCKPGLENTAFRNIAKTANVALGSVVSVTQNLKQKGYLIDTERQGRLLVQKEKLLKKWVAAYSEDLKPKLLINRYQPITANWWQESEFNQNILWSGEIGVSRFIPSFRPTFKPIIATVYIKQTVSEFLQQHQLQISPDGDIEILDVFWEFEDQEQHNNNNIVPPLLIYADLIATGQSRNLEAAKQIYDQELAGLVQEN